MGLLYRLDVSQGQKDLLTTVPGPSSPEQSVVRPMNKDVTSPSLVIVGKVLAPRGLKGEVQAEVISDSLDTFSSGGILYLNGQPHSIQGSSILPKERVRLKLEGIDSRSEADSLRNVFLMVPEDTVPPLPEGMYYHYQILDMGVYTVEGEHLGRVTQILATGSNDVYVASHEGHELLIPAVDEVIVEVDLEEKKMIVDLPEGLRSGP